MNKSIKPVIIPFKRKVRKNRSTVWRTRNVAYCGRCGNPIYPFTSSSYCQHCRANIDWSDAPYLESFRIDEYAIRDTINRV